MFFTVFVTFVGALRVIRQLSFWVLVAVVAKSLWSQCYVCFWVFQQDNQLTSSLFLSELTSHTQLHKTPHTPPDFRHTFIKALLKLIYFGVSFVRVFFSWCGKPTALSLSLFPSFSPPSHPTLLKWAVHIWVCVCCHDVVFHSWLNSRDHRFLCGLPLSPLCLLHSFPPFFSSLPTRAPQSAFRN